MPITLLEQTAASVPTPTTNKLTLFVESADGLVKTKDDAGTVATLGAIANGDKGDITTSGGGATWTVDNDAITYAKMQNVSAAERLLGRGAGGGAGDVQELTLGTNLSMAAGVLNATGGSAPFDDGTAIIKGSADATKLLRFEVDGFTTATTRVATPPNSDFTMAGINIAQTFTATQTFTPAVNTSALVVTGASLTGTDATTFLNYAGTWNTSGTPTALKLNITDTASNAASLLMDLQVGGASKASFGKLGNLTATSAYLDPTSVRGAGGPALMMGTGTQTGLYSSHATDVSVTLNGTRSHAFNANHIYSLTNAGMYIFGALSDAGLGRNAADIVEVNNGTLGTFRDIKVRALYAGASNIVISGTAPTIASGFGTSPSISASNGTAAFTLTIGTATAGIQTGTLTMPAATTGWVAYCQNVTNPDSFIVGQTGGTTTTVTLKNYSRTTGLAIDFTASDVIRIKAMAY